MSKRYPGNFITGNPVALSQTSNNGIWDLKDQYQAQNNGAWQEVDGIYEIGRSLRFRASASGYIQRTPAVASDRRRFTYSVWLKRSDLSGSDQAIMTARTNDSNRLFYYFQPSGFISLYHNIAGTAYESSSASYFRDPSAWYHIVIAVDTTSPVGNNRLRLYVNGVQQTLTVTTNSVPTQNAELQWNNTCVHTIGKKDTSGVYMDSYMTEINSVDGQSLDASYFGYSDPVTGIWQPKKYTGSYGTNGFYLPFKDNQSLTNLGKNYAGSNYFTYSQLGSDSGWNLTNATNTVNSATAPDGTYTANRLTEGTGAATQHRTFRQYSVQSSGAVMCTSIYAKAGTRNIVAIENWSGSSVASMYFNLTTGQPIYGSSDATAINFQYVGNGWYRFWGYVTSNGTGVPSLAIYLCDGSGSVTYNGDGSSYAFWWGAQANLGTSPDTYIPTTSATSINDWTLTNMSLTAGTTYDSMVDSPTNVFTTVTDIGGVVPGNYCTLSSVDKAPNNILSNGGLTTYYYPYANTNNAAPVRGTLGVSGGKWYYEFVVNINNGSGNSARHGLVRSHGRNHLSEGMWNANIENWIGVDASIYNNYVKFYSTGWSSSLADATTIFGSLANGDLIRIAIDLDENKLWIGKNADWYNSGNPSTGSTPTSTFTQPTAPTGPIFTQFEPITSGDNGNRSQFTVNFGQRPFAYAPPTGFKTINTTNLQAQGLSAVAVKPNKWMDATLYTGTGNNQTVTNSAGFQPDLLWIKSRNVSYNNNLYDSARASAMLSSNAGPWAENPSGSPGDLGSLNADGFTINQSSNYEQSNSTTSYVAWQWKQSPTAGFGIVKYTGDGTSSKSISHNLGVAPKMIMVKSRDSTTNWGVGFTDVGWNTATILNAQNATGASSYFASTNPTSSNFFVGNSSVTNISGENYIAYLWAEIPGFSKIGYYIGTGSADAAGPFAHTGFRPKWIMIKNVSVSEQWAIIDTARYTYNDNTAHILFANSSGTEDFNASYHQVDILSNGFKVRGASQPLVNQSNNFFAYIAFAESPFALNNRAR